MLVAIAVLFIHPQLSPTLTLPANVAALDVPAAVSVSNAAAPADHSLPPDVLSADASAQPVAEPIASLPEAPVPAPVPAMNVPPPVAFLRPGKPITVSVGQLVTENRRNQMLWRGLVVASSGAATFDAWSTRHAITTYGAQEMNPMLRPFAGNASLYAAIQVGPLLMDYAGRKMMYSRHSWVRRMWWVPQSASFVSSMFCGAHNLSYH
ncbi:MAG TPA: hypothetical protein VGT24_12105 [Candidatus Acidoferrales bacterium]|nr:hypothetical protein [Candidatus Acidoferrales bacterium]